MANKDPEDIAKPTNIELFLLQSFSKVKEPTQQLTVPALLRWYD